MFKPHIRKVMDDRAYNSFLRVKREVRKVPEMELPSGKNLSCHIVCRLLTKLTGLEYRDGYFDERFEHSWLVLDRYIVDPYPIGLLEGPIIFETEYGLPWRRLYQEEELEVTVTEEFRRDLEFCTSKCLKGEFITVTERSCLIQ